MSNYVDVKNMSADELFDMLDDLSIDQAYDSDAGGDSGAEDLLVYKPRVKDISGSSRSNMNGTPVYDNAPGQSNESYVVSDNSHLMNIDLGGADTSLENEPDYFPNQSQG